MKRLIVLAACLALVSVACKKSAEPPAAGQPAAPPAATAPAGGPSAPAEARPAEPKKIEITDDMVSKYMEYQKENLSLVQKYVAETTKNIESAKGDAMKTLNQISINEKAAKDMEAKLDAKRQALGLDQEQFDTLKDAVQMMATGRAAYNQMGGDAQLAKIEAEQKAALAKLPPEQRSAAEAQMAEMGKSFRDMRDGFEVRKKYGDKSTDVLLKRADELAKQYWDALKAMGGKK
jgi:hypothetical protein